MISISTCKWATVSAVIIQALSKHIFIRSSALQFYYWFYMCIKCMHIKQICLLLLKRNCLHSTIITGILYQWVSTFDCFEGLWHFQNTGNCSAPQPRRFEYSVVHMLVTVWDIKICALHLCKAASVLFAVKLTVAARHACLQQRPSSHWWWHCHNRDCRLFSWVRKCIPVPG